MYICISIALFSIPEWLLLMTRSRDPNIFLRNYLSAGLCPQCILATGLRDATCTTDAASATDAKRVLWIPMNR